MNENLSRRRFLQGACIGVGALTLSGCDDKKPDKKLLKKRLLAVRLTGFLLAIFLSSARAAPDCAQRLPLEKPPRSLASS